MTVELRAPAAGGGANGGIFRIACLAVVWFALLPATVRGQTAPDAWTLQVTVGGKVLLGTPLAWDSRVVLLLGRDGQLLQFAPKETTNPIKASDTFRPYSYPEFRSNLLRELGSDFEVTGTQHYVVAHPPGQRDVWPKRFEQLYRSFDHYFSVRRFDVPTPRFTMVAIVCRDRAEMDRVTKSIENPIRAGYAGFYSPKTNRIYLHDQGGEAKSSRIGQANLRLVIHEATHQTAYNTKIHGRFGPNPLWVVEGLATMFEAPGVHDSRSNPRQADRIHYQLLDRFMTSVLPQHTPERLAYLIATDDAFEANPKAAYAHAWALTFYLVETQPADYARYLAKTGARPPFTGDTPEQRTTDFTSVFGSDWRMLEARMLRFLAKLK